MDHPGLYYETSGAGEIPLVCVHGWACDGSQFFELSELLNDNFKIFRLDLPGHGKTPLNEFKPSFNEYSKAISNFCSSQTLERPILLGHSMGGVLCMMAAAKRNIQPRAVINLDGSLPCKGNTGTTFEWLRRILNQSDFRTQLMKVLHQSLFLDTERGARSELIVHGMCSAPDSVLQFVPAEFGSLRPNQVLPRIAAPVLFVGSAAPRFDSEKAASLIPRLTIETIPEAGHFLHIYSCGKLASIIKSFLEDKVSR